MSLNQLPHNQVYVAPACYSANSLAAANPIRIAIPTPTSFPLAAPAVIAAALPLALLVLLALSVVVAAFVVVAFVLVPAVVFVVFVVFVSVAVVAVVVFVVDPLLCPELVGTPKTLLIVNPLGTSVPNVGRGTFVRILRYLVYKLGSAADFVAALRSCCGIDVDDCASAE